MFKKISPILFSTMVLATSCKDNSEKEKNWRTKKEAVANETHNQLLEVEKEQGWELLFDGETLNGWHLYNSPEGESVWEVKNGEIHTVTEDESLTAGDLLTDKPYKNYELTLEWKIASRGNSGIFMNVQEREDIPTAWQTGPEYQILDADHMDINIAEKNPGCLYVFQSQVNPVEMKRGEWNRTRIKQVDGKVEFYLNGVLTAQEDFSSPEWKQQIAATHFEKYPEFGKATEGKIALQYWYFETWFRDIKIREL